MKGKGISAVIFIFAIVVAGFLIPTFVLRVGATEHPRLPGWMRIGSDTSGSARPDATMKDNNPVPHCSIATVAGQWVWRYTAKTDTGVDVGGVGSLTIEHNGSDSFHGWFTIGQDVEEVTATGTITVNPDCSGTQKWGEEPPFGVYTVGVARGGREIWFQSQPPEWFGLTIANRIK